MNARTAFVLGSILVASSIAPTRVAAQADEIQVYDAGLAPVGVFNLTWHNNYTPSGIETPAFPGGIVSDGALVGVTDRKSTRLNSSH